MSSCQISFHLGGESHIANEQERKRERESYVIQLWSVAADESCSDSPLGLELFNSIGAYGKYRQSTHSNCQSKLCTSGKRVPLHQIYIIKAIDG